MKIPPKLLFKVQMVATLISSITQIGVLNWMFNNIPNICTPEAINGFTCPIARVHFNGSILWGVVGPQRFFGEGALYRPLVWAFLLGFIAPIIIWLIGRRSSESSVWRKINFPVLFGSLSWIPPAVRLSPYTLPSLSLSNNRSTPLNPSTYSSTKTDRSQFLHLGSHQLPLQLPPPPPRTRLVGKIHNDAFRGFGLRSRNRCCRCVLLFPVSWVELGWKFERLVGGNSLQGSSSISPLDIVWFVKAL